MACMFFHKANMSIPKAIVPNIALKIQTALKL
jgi:hypothetical protein